MDNDVVNENSPNETVVGNFVVGSNSSIPKDQFRFSIVDATNVPFKIINKNQLVVADSSRLDYEDIAKRTYEIEVKADFLITDPFGGGNQSVYADYGESEFFTIIVKDVNDTDDPGSKGCPINPSDLSVSAGTNIPNGTISGYNGSNNNTNSSECSGGSGGGSGGSGGGSGGSGSGLIPPEPKPDQNFTIPIRRATDPNDIIGPAGFGDENWIAPQTLPYTIRFENIATATAPAQTVTITHPLDTDLDFRSFRLSSFGWGGLTFDVPENRSFYSQRLDLTEENGILVDVFAGIDTKKGEAFWTITTIDPKTGETPEDPLAGFLPPNIANGIGDGFVNYTIRPKRDVQTGTVIDAEATIIFDTEEPINTPHIFNTIDVDKPITKVTNLPTASTTPEFLVSWEGTDKGSAIGNYTIYVSDNDGEFKPWLIDTTLTESTYTGVVGHTYKFSAIATDNAGNSQEISALNTTPVTEATATIGDFVWVDSNADGIQNPGELGLANVTVNLYNNAANLVSTTTTTANGSYSFTNIATGDYTVEVVAPTGYLLSDAKQGTDTALDSNVDSKTGKTEIFTATPGNNLTVDAGLYQLASITGQKWNDLDGDGVKDTNESGLKDGKIYLDTNTNGQLDTGELSTTTDADGNYSFTNLRPGTYTVAEEIQTGWKQTYPGVSVTTTASDIQLLSPTVEFTSSPDTQVELNFNAVNYIVKEDGTALTEIIVTRTGNSSGAVSATLSFVDGTAEGCGCVPTSVRTDFYNGAFTVNFADGETSKTIPVELASLGGINALRIRNDAKVEGDEYFSLQLTNPTGGASIGNQNIAKVTIIDDESSSDVSVTPVQNTTPLQSPSITSSSFESTNATNLINLDDFWADSRFSNIKGQGYSTVIIDTGADLNHPLFGADADNNGIADRIVYQYDFADNDTDASDKNNHGSHIASIASAVAPDANLIILKVFKDNGAGFFADLEKALQWVNQNASAYNIASVNLSVGDGQNWNTPISRYGIGDELAAIASKDILISAAAGNNFYTYNSSLGLAYPAIDPNTISVGAVWTDNFGSRTFSNGAKDNTTAPDTIASFTQRSSLLDVFAPGILITGANANGGTTTMGGTSQAAPYVTAIATLAQQIAQTNLGRKLSLAEFRNLLATKSDLIIDGDNEDDNVTNTGAKYPRINVLSLAEGILSLSTNSTTVTPTTPTNNGTKDSLEIPNNNNLNLVHTVTLTSGQIVKDLNFGNQKLNQLPTLNNISKSGNEDAKITFSSSDFTSAFIDADSNSLTKIKISALPDKGTFQLNSIAVTLNQEIPVGELDKLVFIPDLNFSGNINFAWNGFDGTDYATNPAQVNLTINPLPRIALDANITNAAEPATPGKFTLTRTGNTSQTLTVNYTLGGTATNSVDYQNLSGTVTFKAGEDKANIDLNPIDDKIFEGNETVTLTLTNGGTNYKLDTIKSSTISIADNDTKPTISVTNISHNEGNNGTTNYDFNLTLSNPSTETVTVKYTTADDTATAGSDYTAVTDSITFNPGETTKTVNIKVNGDDLYEADETFKLNLSDAVNATITNNSATGTIVNDDLPIISIDLTDADAAEPNNPGKFTLTRTGITTQDLTVNYTLTGTATNGTDYQNLTGTATFNVGEDKATIDINPIDDKIYEGTETVILSLTADPAYIIPAAPSAIVNITDNDAQTPQIIQPFPNLLSIEGGTEKSLLKLTKTAQEGLGKNEAFAFVVDDEQGRIGGIAPGQAGYLNAALDRSQVIFSNLGNNSIDLGFDRDSQRYLNFTPGDRIQFGLVADDSIDAVKADLSNGKSTDKVLFSLPDANAGNSTQAKFTALPNNGGYEIAWEDNLDEGKGNSNADFNDFVMKIDPLDNFKPPVGTGLQGKPEGEVIDLRDVLTGQPIKVHTFTVSDAAYNNYIGFYAVEDALGTLANGLKVGDIGYAEAAIKSAVLNSSKNETQIDRLLTGGKIFAPVVIANGTFEEYLKINPQNQVNSNIHAYFNYLGANPDKVDHFRLLGDNKFGVEDLYGGGDKDYNDIVFQMNVIPFL